MARPAPACSGDSATLTPGMGRGPIVAATAQGHAPTGIPEGIRGQPAPDHLDGKAGSVRNRVIALASGCESADRCRLLLAVERMEVHAGQVEGTTAAHALTAF